MRRGEGGGGSGISTRPTRSSSSASRANQPTASKLGASATAPSALTRPWVGRKPKIPQKLAGRRTDPAQSVPSAMSASPPATAEAEPLDEPPGMRPGARGLTGVP